jgi:basic amino acid/polyamine antiporter, APA family
MKKKLSLLDATLIVSGSMIGSGIFIVSSDMARSMGSAGWLLAAWIVTGIITIFGALSYGELAGMMPNAGGQYIYIQKAFGKLPAFSFGFSVFAVIQTGVIAAVAVAFAKYTAVFIPFFDEKNILLDLGFIKLNNSQIIAVASIWLLTFFNANGLENGKFLQRIFTLAKLIALFGLIVLGIAFFSRSGQFTLNFENAFSMSSLSKDSQGIWSLTQISGIAVISVFMTSMIGSLFSSDAWNNVTYIAGEIDNPKRNIPLSLMAGTIIVTLLYCFANVAYLNLLPVKGLPEGQDVISRGIQYATNDRVGAAAAEVMFGAIGSSIMAALIMVSTFGCNNGLILSGARLYKAMADDKLFFTKLGVLNKKEVPANALYAQAFWASLLCLSGTYGKLLDYTTFTSLLFYIVTVFGVIVLRKKMPDAERPYKTLGYPVVPLVYIFLASAVCINLLFTRPETSLIGVGIIALSIPVFYFMNRKN